LTLALLVFGMSVASAHAAPMTFWGGQGSSITATQAETDFLAALAISGTDTVDSLFLLTNDPTLTFGATGITATADNTLVVDILPVSGLNALYSGEGNEVFTFSALVNGFGAFFNHLGTVDPATTLNFQLENTVLGSSQTVSFGPFGPDGGSVAYLGVIDATNPFNRLTVLASNENDLFFYDNLSAGLAVSEPVPEPASLTLLGLGLAGIGARRWRHRKAT
jgi:hypothetical protein